MSVVDAIHSALVRAGLGAPPGGPHEFERAIHMLSQPSSGGPSVATVPHIVTPASSSERCAREGCGLPPNAPIHQVSAD